MADNGFDNLLFGWEEEALSAEQLDAMADALERNAGARARAVRHFALSAQIAQHLRHHENDAQIARRMEAAAALARQDAAQPAVAPASNTATGGVDPASSEPGCLPGAAPSNWVGGRQPKRTAWRSGRRPRIALAALVAAVVIGGVYVSFRFAGEPPSIEPGPRLVAWQGELTARDAAGRAIEDLAIGRTFRAGETIAAGAGSFARLRYGDGTTIDLAAKTRIEIASHDGGKQVELAGGAAFFNVARQPDEAPMVLNPGRYDQVRVVGTEFELARSENVGTQIRVRSGAVVFGTGEKSQRVARMQRSVAGPDTAPTAAQPVGDESFWSGPRRSLAAVYYDNDDFTGVQAIRRDEQIDFDWGNRRPHPEIETDTFSAVWTGFIEAASSARYTFFVEADDGVKLWVDGRLLIDTWDPSLGGSKTSPPVTLTEGQLASLQIQYRHRLGRAHLRLLWSSPMAPREVVPAERLYSLGGR